MLAHRLPGRLRDEPPRWSRRSGRRVGTFSCALALAASGAAAADAEVIEQAAPAGEVAGEEIIVVTGTRSESPRAASPVTTEVIDRQRLAESGVQTAAEALALRPGLWIERGIAGTAGIAIQGLGPQYTMVLVDGARQIGRTDGVLDLDRFGVEDVEQIEIVRGPSSVLYGSDALGGVVNVVTRRARREGSSLDALARLDGRLGHELRGRLAGGARGYAGSLAGSYRDAPAIRIDDDGTAIATTLDAYTDGHVTARGTHWRGEAWRFDASADYLRRDLRGVDVAGGGAVLDRRNLVETVSTQAIAAWTGERTAIRAEAAASRYRDQFLSDQRMSGALDQYQLTEEDLVEGRVQVARQLGRHRALAGGELLREALASERLSVPGDRLRAALYAQDEWRAGSRDQVIVVPAARLDADSQFGVHATPRLAARWQLGRAVVRGSAGMGYRAPSFKELLLRFENAGAGYLIEGNPELEPETSISAQAGGEWQATAWLWLAADGYVNRLRDMIFTLARPDDGSGTLRFGYENIGRARTAGVEAYAIAVRGRAALELGLAITRTRDLDAGRPLEGIPAHRGTVTARWRDPRAQLDGFVAAVLTGERPFYLSSEEPRLATRTGRRVELRARIGKRFRSGAGGFLGIDNALDAGDAHLDRLPPRTLYAGVELHR